MQHSATSTSPSDIFDRALDETLLWLCAIASPIGDEKEICDAVEERMLKLRLAAPVRRYNNSIVVPLTRSQTPGRPKIALVGHLDTVRTENGPPRLDDGRCFGSGAADMKSGLSVMIAVAETMLATIDFDLTLVFYSKEEGPFAENELGEVLEKDPDLKHQHLAICLEPSDNRVHLGCNGSLHATVTFEGKTGHSARPWEAENAITKAAQFLTEMSALRPEDHVIDGYTYKSVFTVTQAKDGGRGRNVVPEKFLLNINHRFTPDTTIQQAEEHLRALVAGRAHIEIVDRSPPAAPNANHPLIKKLIECGVVGVEPKQAWTDVARFAQAGVAAVNFGPGENAQAHQKNESTSLALLHDGFRIMKRYLASLRG
jgi:succinyl-diaminopimelate desuccinylase